MSSELTGKRIAILAADGFEEVELTQPKQALENAGAVTVVVSPASGAVRAWRNSNWSIELPVDEPLSSANASDFDAILLPGGVMNPDKLRILPEAIDFIRDFAEAGKPIAAICHGPWTLIDAGVVKGRRLTSWPSLKADITNAGGVWEDSEVIVDKGLVTSRKPDDIPAFNSRMIEEFAEDVHSGRLELVGFV